MIKIISKDGKEKIWKRSVKNKLPTIYTNNKCILPVDIHWVPEKYRTNPLSLKEGGSNVIVEYYENKILGYSNIKLPSAYIKKIFKKEILNIYVGPKNHNLDEINVLKKEIRIIYAKKYNENNYQKIWHKNSIKLPWDILESFDLPRN